MFHLMLVVFQSYELKENSSPMKEGMVQSMKEEMKNSEDLDFRGKLKLAAELQQCDVSQTDVCKI